MEETYEYLLEKVQEKIVKNVEEKALRYVKFFLNLNKKAVISSSFVLLFACYLFRFLCPPRGGNLYWDCPNWT